MDSVPAGAAALHGLGTLVGGILLRMNSRSTSLLLNVAHTVDHLFS